VVPPDTGIVHQVNVEYLARVVFGREVGGVLQAYPDTLVGTDSHTTMINGVGVLGWGVGGIEAEASMLGQPVSMLIPKVVGVKLTGQLPEGATATDLVLTIVEMLRKHGVVGKFVEFYGPAVKTLPMGDRSTIANMGPEYGATCGLFPIDDETLDFLRLTGRSDEQVALVEAYAKAQGMFDADGSFEADYSEKLTLDIGTVVPSLAGPKRPQDRVALTDVKASFEAALSALNQGARRHHQGAGQDRHRRPGGRDRRRRRGDRRHHLLHQHVQPQRHARRRPGRQEGRRAGPERAALGQDLARPGLDGGDALSGGVRPDGPLKQLGFHVVGYGCTTCIGNSGPLRPEVSKAIADGDLTAARCCPATATSRAACTPRCA
jgi:aconitate hydratase